MNAWHVWSINQQRYRKVQEYLDSVSEVEMYLYPTVSKEVSTKHTKRIKYTPLYSNYIFIKYDHSPLMMVKLANCQWLKSYVGPCSQHEIDYVELLTKKTYEELLPPVKIDIGSCYKLIGTPFKGLICTVREMHGDRLLVSVEIFGSDRLVKCCLDDIMLEGA